MDEVEQIGKKEEEENTLSTQLRKNLKMTKESSEKSGAKRVVWY